ALARAGRWVRRRPAQAALLLVLGLAPFALLAALLWHNWDLAVKRDEARADAALSHRKADFEVLMGKGQAARAAKDLQSAKLHFEAAVERAGSDPSLVGLRAEADRQRDGVKLLLDRLADRASRYERFRKKRDAALFLEARFTGRAAPADVRATRAAAQ